MKNQLTNDEKLWVARVFVPDDISMFSERSFKDLPILKTKINGKYLTAYYDSFENTLVDENGDKVVLDKVNEFSIQIKPNPNFDVYDSEDE